MSDRIHGAPSAADKSIVIRCSCAAGCLAAFDRWDDVDGHEFYGEMYTGFHPTQWRDRIKNAWTCLRGREMTAASMVLNRDAAQALGEFMQPEAPYESVRELDQEIDRLRTVIRDVLALKSSYFADHGMEARLVNNLQAREMLEARAAGHRGARMMEGRWTIVPIAGDGIIPDFSETQPTQVVPCDAAAVERVAAKLAELQGYHVGPLEIDRRSARDLLRAAAREDR